MHLGKNNKRWTINLSLGGFPNYPFGTFKMYTDASVV